MLRTACTGARPPQTTRLPREVPLSRASGATPTSAAMCLRFSRPSSGAFVNIRISTPNIHDVLGANGCRCPPRSRRPGGDGARPRAGHRAARLSPVRQDDAGPSDRRHAAQPVLRSGHRPPTDAGSTTWSWRGLAARTSSCSTRSRPARSCCHSSRAGRSARSGPRYLVLGSASPSLVRGAAESLAGRVEFVELSGFDLPDRRALLGSPRVGASWKSFVIEAGTGHRAPIRSVFWATHGGAKLDLFYSVAGRRVGVEVKFSEAPEVTRSMRTAPDDLALDELWLVLPGRHTYQVDERIRACAIHDLAALAPTERRARTRQSRT